MTEADPAATAVARARDLYLDDEHLHGCAETAFVTLKAAFDLPDPGDSAAAMALNGGIAYTGATCGAVTGAALALGLLAASRRDDHVEAKLAARLLTADLLAAFEAQFGTSSCRALTGVDLRAPGGHAAFLASGAWREGCMRQLEMVVARLAPLGDSSAWEDAVARVSGSE